MRIEPYDGDNQKMYVYNPEDMFVVSLENEDTTSSIGCSTTQPTSDGDPDFHLSAACNIPDLSKAEGAAGEWELVVTLNLVTVFTKRVDMWCPQNYYEKEGEQGLLTCIECDTLTKGSTSGAICSEVWDSHAFPSGTTLQRVILKGGYWRANLNAERIYLCPLEDACEGGGDGEYCGTGYHGPFCTTCERGYFMCVEAVPNDFYALSYRRVRAGMKLRDRA